MAARIFLTGLGVVSSLGQTVARFWERLCAGDCGLSQVTIIDVSDLPVRIGGEVKEPDLSVLDEHPLVSAHRMDRASQFAVLSARQALRQAGLPVQKLGDRTGVLFGAGLSGMLTLQEQTERLLRKGSRGVSPLTIPLLMPNAACANISLAFGATGPSHMASSACSSSAHAMIASAYLLAAGDADVVITGGTEASITRLGISSFANIMAMTKRYNDDPARAMRPFDAERDGFIMSEGAGAIILESESSVRSRGARPLAELVGWGATTDAHHLVAPDPSAEGAARAMRLALQRADLAPGALVGRACINAHGTATRLNDAAETRAVTHVFGCDARRIPMSSTKSMTGHLIGAAAAVETVACVQSLLTGRVPPTINYRTPDPDCDIDCVPNESRSMSCQYAINNSFGFGGHNACLVFKGVD